MKMKEKEIFLLKIKELNEDIAAETMWLRERKQRVNKRIREKLSGKGKLHIIFLVHRPSLWGTYKTIYSALMEDERFKVSIVASPNKKQVPVLDLGHEEYIDEGAYGFFKDYDCAVYQAYDPELRTWLDLKELDPDLVFFQTPYNICRPKVYHSNIVSDYALTAYIPYGMEIMGAEVMQSTMPKDFLADCDIIFSQTELYAKRTRSLLSAYPVDLQPDIFMVGEPRFDILLGDLKAESPAWNFPRSDNKFRVLWTPRWTIEENNSHVLDYIDSFIELCHKMPDLDFVFRPHPQTAQELLAKGHLSERQLKIYEDAFKQLPNASIDKRGQYQDTILSADIIISDTSSMMHEYAVAGKAVIYCHKSDCFVEEAAILAQGFYWAYCWKDLVRHICQLKSGKDELAEKRKELRGLLYRIPKNGAGREIKNILFGYFFNTEADLIEERKFKL